MPRRLRKARSRSSTCDTVVRGRRRLLWGSRALFFLAGSMTLGKPWCPRPPRPARLVIDSISRQASKRDPTEDLYLYLFTSRPPPCPRLPWRWAGASSEETPAGTAPPPHKPSPGSFAPTPRRASCGLGGFVLVYLLIYMTSWFYFSSGALVAGHASTLLVPAKQEGSAADTQREDERCRKVNTNDMCGT